MSFASKSSIEVCLCVELLTPFSKREGLTHWKHEKANNKKGLRVCSDLSLLEAICFGGCVLLHAVVGHSGC